MTVKTTHTWTVGFESECKPGYAVRDNWGKFPPHARGWTLCRPRR